MVRSQFRDGGQKQQEDGVSDVIPQINVRRVPGTPMDDSDVEEFLQLAARIVLRVKGLAGSASEASRSEENRDTA